MAKTLVALHNQLKDARTVTMSDSDTDYPVGRLYDDQPGRYARWASKTTPRITADFQLFQTSGLDDGLFDVWIGGAPRGFSGSSITEETVDVVSGSAVKAAGAGAVYRTVYLRAGRSYRFTVQAKSTGGGTAALRGYNAKTGQWLQPDGTWGAFTTAATRTNAAYGELALNFTMESFSAIGADLAPVELRMAESAGAGNAFFDNAAAFPALDLVSVHWHNIEPLWTMKLQSSDDGSSWTDRHTFSNRHWLTFYGRLSSLLYHRHWRVELSGSPVTANVIPWIGELFFSQAIELSKPMLYGWEVTPRVPQVRHALRSGEQLVYALLDRPFRTWRLPFRHVQAENAQLYEILERTIYGGKPLVFVPRDDEPAVGFCHPPPERGERREFLDVNDSTEVILEEAPAPAVAES